MMQGLLQSKRFLQLLRMEKDEYMTHIKEFSELTEGIRSHLGNTTKNTEKFLPFYNEALLFMQLSKILPDNDFTQKRLAQIGRNLALTIYFAMHDMCEEAQILLRQVLDLIYIILYGANHILELNHLDEGKIDQIGNIRTDINRRLPSELKNPINRLYRKLSSVVHGTIRDILLQVATVKESWINPGKFGHWEHDFHLTLEYGICLCRSWLPQNYAKLDVSLRAELEKAFSSLSSLWKNY